MKGVQLFPDDLERVEQICAKIKGYSGPHHYGFFKGVFSQFTHIKNILIVGVYQGRDMAFMMDMMKVYHPEKRFHITGVDKFSDDACDDWPKEKRGMTWGKAGFGEAPTFEKAMANLHNYETPFKLYKCDDKQFFEGCHLKFDFIYLDSSHDEKTLLRQARQCARLCSGSETVIAGDDYSDVSNVSGGTWGVKEAVTKAFTHHELFASWIWISDREHLRL